MCEGHGVPTENLANDVRIEDEARHSSVSGTQPHAGATQESVEVVPPPLTAIIGLGREAHEPPPQRQVFVTRAASANALSR